MPRKSQTSTMVTLSQGTGPGMSTFAEPAMLAPPPPSESMDHSTRDRKVQSRRVRVSDPDQKHYDRKVQDTLVGVAEFTESTDPKTRGRKAQAPSVRVSDPDLIQHDRKVHALCVGVAEFIESTDPLARGLKAQDPRVRVSDPDHLKIDRKVQKAYVGVAEFTESTDPLARGPRALPVPVRVSDPDRLNDDRKVQDTLVGVAEFTESTDHSYSDRKVPLADVRVDEPDPFADDRKVHIPAVGLVELPETVARVMEFHNRREDFVNARRNALLQVKSICRRWNSGDKKLGTEMYNAVISPRKEHPMKALFLSQYGMMVDNVKALSVQLNIVTEELEFWAARLPCAEWFTSVRGLGLTALGQIIGEAGDLSAFATEGKLWVRLGIGLVDGEAQRRIKGNAEKAKRMRFNPSRRAKLFVIGNNLMMMRTPVYREIYEREHEKAIVRGCEPRHANFRANRVVCKRLTRDLWRRWRRAVAEMKESTK